MKVQMSAVPEGEGVETAPEPAPVRVRMYPRGHTVHTEKAAQKVKASALRKVENFKKKITQAQSQLDHLKAERNKKASRFVYSAEQYDREIAAMSAKTVELAMRSESLQGEITRLQEKVKLMQADSGRVMQARNKIMQDLAATGILLKAAQQKVKEAGLENTPKIDQLTKTRDKLITRLYHHQLLHPGTLPEKADTDA